jgi:hypothetical protein
MAMQFLDSQNVTSNLLEKWMEMTNSFKSDYDLARVMYGLSSILKIPQN